jgi:HSP20 family protein
MRMRYRYVTYRPIDGSQKQLEQHYRQLLHDALRQSQQSMLDRSAAWRPPADILESAELFTIRVELAGMREEEIEVTLYEDALVISGERHNTQKSQENVYYHEAQIRYGPFRVEIFIPAPVKREAVTARYENGFLQVDLPRALEKKPERVSIQQTVMKE